MLLINAYLLSFISHKAMSFGMLYRIIRHKINEFKIMSIFVNVKIVHWTFWLIKKSTSSKWILKALWIERMSFWEPQMYDTWRRTGREICLRIITCSSRKEHWRLCSLDLSIYRWRNWGLGTCIIMIIFNMAHSCYHSGLDPRSFLFSGDTFFLVPHSSQTSSWVYVCAKEEEAVISCYSCRVTCRQNCLKESHTGFRIKMWLNGFSVSLFKVVSYLEDGCA